MTGGKLKLRKGYRETIEAAREYAAEHGALVSFDLVGKHPKIIVSREGISASAPFPSTPRTSEFWNHARRAVKRALSIIESQEGL
jgi:sugar/nucleoside kinase (ribokinase family)